MWRRPQSESAGQPRRTAIQQLFSIDEVGWTGRRPMLRMRVMILIAAFAAIAIPQTPFHRATQFEQQPALTIANDRLEATVSAQGGALVNLVLLGDPEDRSTLLDPVDIAAE